MKQVHLHSAAWLKSERMTEIIKEIEDDPDCIMLRKGEEVEVIIYGKSPGRDPWPTGKSYIGYEGGYINFKYLENYYSLEVGYYYPFEPPHITGYIYIPRNTRYLNSVDKIQQATYGDNVYQDLQHLKANYYPFFAPLEGTYPHSIPWEVKV